MARPLSNVGRPAAPKNTLRRRRLVNKLRGNPGRAWPAIRRRAENMAFDENNLSMSEEQAFQLTQAALRIDRARARRAEDPSGLTDSLNQNLEVWVALRTAVMSENCELPDEVCQNLAKLSQFVADKTFSDGEIAETTLDAFVHINLQIAEGLLEGHGRKAV